MKNETLSPATLKALRLDHKFWTESACDWAGAAAHSHKLVAFMLARAPLYAGNESWQESVKELQEDAQYRAAKAMHARMNVIDCDQMLKGA